MVNLPLFTSGVIDNDIQDMTLGDILARDIVLMQKGSDKKILPNLPKSY